MRLLSSLLTTLILLTPEARAETRRLTLAEAVDLAMRSDPIVAEARTAESRANLGVLRAQLDRVSLKVDASLQELWNASNIGGATTTVCPITLGNTPLGATAVSSASMCVTPMGSPFTLGPTYEVGGSSTGAQGLLNISAQTNVPLYTGGRVTANVRRAQRSEDAATVAVRQARRDTSLAVARTYWAVRRIGLLREVQEQALTRMREAEAVTGGRVKAGLATPIDENRARLRRVQQMATLADLLGQEREAAAQVGVSLGIAAGEDVVLVDPPLVPDARPRPVEELLDQALHGRAELAGARLQLKVQDEIVTMQRANYYPQLGLFGLFQIGNNPFIPGLGSRSASTTANPFTGITGNFTVGAQASINLFDTFNTLTSVRDATYEADRLMGESRRLARVVESDVRLAHAKLLHLYDRLTPLRESREIARDNLVILEGRYKNGEALVIEYLDAQIDLVNSELSIADVTAQLALAWIELDASLGHVVGERP